MVVYGGALTLLPVAVQAGSSSAALQVPTAVCWDQPLCTDDDDEDDEEDDEDEDTRLCGFVCQAGTFLFSHTPFRPKRNSKSKGAKGAKGGDGRSGEEDPSPLVKSPPFLPLLRLEAVASAAQSFPCDGPVSACWVHRSFFWGSAAEGGLIWSFHLKPGCDGDEYHGWWSTTSSSSTPSSSSRSTTQQQQQEEEEELGQRAM